MKAPLIFRRIFVSFTVIAALLCTLTGSASGRVWHAIQNGKQPQDAPPTNTNSLPAEQAKAHDVVMRFLQGIQMTTRPEGEKLLARTQWIVGPADRGEDFYSHRAYSEAKSVSASLFSTDMPAIKGYKELFETEADTQDGITRTLKFLVIAFEDAITGEWKVFGSVDNWDNDSSIDMDHQVSAFDAHLRDTRYTSEKENYGRYAYWLLMDGRIADATSALNFADNPPFDPSAPAEPAHVDSIVDLQIKALRIAINTIGKIAPTTAQAPR